MPYYPPNLPEQVVLLDHYHMANMHVLAACKQTNQHFSTAFYLKNAITNHLQTLPLGSILLPERSPACEQADTGIWGDKTTTTERAKPDVRQTWRLSATTAFAFVYLPSYAT